MHLDNITLLIERIFRSRHKIVMAVYERKHGHGICTFTGGPGTNHCRVPDPTAIQAIRNAVELDCVQIDDGFRVLHPERWLRVYDAVQRFCEPDPIDREIFIRKYERCETGKQTCINANIEQSVYSRHLLKIRNHAKMCAAQEQLIRIF